MSRGSATERPPARRIPGFDQAPDFIIPDEWNPRVVIEAKISEDDGTARDKVTRIQHLAELSAQKVKLGKACFRSWRASTDVASAYVVKICGNSWLPPMEKSSLSEHSTDWSIRPR